MQNSDTLLTGRIGPALLKFAVPFMMASFLQALYGAVDLFVVGRYSGSAAVSAVSIGSQVMMMVTSILMGISTGGTVLIAHRVGENAHRKAAEAVGTLVVLFLILAVVLTPLMLLLTKSAVSLMSTPAEAVQDARIYIRICSAGVPFIIGYNGVSAIFRGIGDSKTPVLFIVIACIANIIGDFLFVGVMHMGAAGAFSSAVATMSAQNLGAGDALRAKRAWQYGMLFSFIFGTLVCLFAQLFPNKLPAVFSKEGSVIIAAGQYMRTYAIDCMLVSFVFNTNSYFSSYGKTLICFAHSMVATFMFRIPATWLFSKIAVDSLLPMGWAAPLASLSSIIICLFYLPRLTEEKHTA